MLILTNILALRSTFLHFSVLKSLFSNKNSGNKKDLKNKNFCIPDNFRNSNSEDMWH